MRKHQVTDAQYAQTLAAGQTEAEAEFRAQAVRYIVTGNQFAGVGVVSDSSLHNPEPRWRTVAARSGAAPGFPSSLVQASSRAEGCSLPALSSVQSRCLSA
jgi:hypothetical protein